MLLSFHHKNPDLCDLSSIDYATLKSCSVGTGVKVCILSLSLSAPLCPQVANVDLVIEAVPENMELKHKLFTELDAVCSQKTIFASNTSSLSIGELLCECE